MKALLINGRPRPHGCTYTALTELKKTLESEGIEVELIHVGNKDIRGCIACRKCLKAAPDKFNPQGFMIRAVYTNPPDESVIEAAKCPRKCLLTPEQHLEAVREDAKKKEGAA